VYHKDSLSKLRDAKYDTRGARLEWKHQSIRVDGEIFEGIVVNCPSWILNQIESEVLKRGGRLVRFRNAPFLSGFIFDEPPNDELLEFLALLNKVCTVGKKYAGVELTLVLDLYKIPDENVDPQNWRNTPSGSLMNSAKYAKNHDAFEALAMRLSTIITRHPRLKATDCIISVPGSDTSTESFGERLARRVAQRVGKPFVRSIGLYEKREQSKTGLAALTQSQVEVQLGHLAAKSAIIVDDVIRSGSSLSAIALAAEEVGIETIFAIAGAKTLRN